LGLMFGLWFIGIENVNPFNTKWISKGDLLSSQIQWNFYRKTPIIQWPITAIPNYGESLGTVVGSGIALVEIPLKLVNQVLPSNFQYFGLWILACFVLQGHFAAKILGHFNLSVIAKNIGSIIFITSPILVLRIGELGHPMLAAHFLILGSIVLYLNNDQNDFKWLILLVISMLTNLYLFVIVYGVYIARVIQNVVVQRNWVSIKANMQKVLYSTFIAICVFVFLGYFNFRNSELGSGFFRLDIYGLLNPGYAHETSFSWVANLLDADHSSIRRFHDYEGVAYLGLAPLIGLILYIQNMRLKNYRSEVANISGIILIAMALFLVALSNRISVAGFEISYWWPTILTDLRQAFRAATRFSWLIYYVLMLLGLVALFRYASKGGRRTYLAGMLLLVHIIDIFPAISHLHVKQTESEVRESSLSSSLWPEIAQSKDRLILYPNFDLQSLNDIEFSEIWHENWQDFALFAIDEGLNTNFVYASRSMFTEIEKQNRASRALLLKGEITGTDIWLIGDESLWKFMKASHMNLNFEQIDGYFVVYSKNE
jgi:hypothetical protein